MNMLNFSCSQLPPSITHLSHPYHPLLLTSTSPYPIGARFYCDACYIELTTGFFYHCFTCNFDLHVECIMKPLIKNHKLHPHPLHLTFDPPYGNGSRFTCDVCDHVGTSQWLYRCNACGFDVHLDCPNSAQSEHGVLQSQRKLVQSCEAPAPAKPAKKPAAPSQRPRSEAPVALKPTAASVGVVAPAGVQAKPGRSRAGAAAKVSNRGRRSKVTASRRRRSSTSSSNTVTSVVGGLLGGIVEGFVGATLMEVGQSMFEKLILDDEDDDEDGVDDDDDDEDGVDDEDEDGVDDEDEDGVDDEDEDDYEDEDGYEDE